MVPYFLDLEQIEENKKKEEIEGILEDFLAFLSNIFKANSALIHLVSKCLVKNYPYQTNHICIVINENNEMKINDYNGEIHMCDCSFLKIILSVWSERINNEELLFFFLQNFRMKVIIGLTYIAIYDKIIKNKPPNLYEFIYQIYNSDIILNLIKSPILISNMFKYYYKYLENDIKNNAFIKIEEVPKIIFNDIHSILTEKNINLFSDNLELFKNLLNIIELCNNLNTFEINDNINTFQREGYFVDLCILESSILDIFIYLISFFNFDNNELVKNIIQIYVDKFNNYRFLNENTYSFHIILIRSFSIFLNRFCLHYSIKNKSDFYDSIKYIIHLIPNYENVIDFLVKEQMKFIGFLLSIESNFFIYYGENMKNYIIIFFRNELIYLSDFNLIKLLFSLEETKKYFSIKKIFELCKIKNFHSLFISNILSNLENSNFDFLNNSDDYKKELNLIKKIFEFIIKAIKDTSSLYLLYEYPLRYKKKVKIVDEFEEYFLNNEENSIYNIIKRNIINYSMTKQNLFKYSNFKQC